MNLWTIQHESAWHKARNTGCLRADGRRLWRGFRESYRWMTTEMRRRIGKPPRGVQYPVWAWLQYDGESMKRPDLRHSGHLPPGTSGILIEFAAPERDVLLSDFELWHYVLNRSYLPQRPGEVLLENPPAAWSKRGRMEPSWQRIFDLDWFLEDISVERSKRSIQGTIWEVPLSAVVSATPFTAR